MYSLSANYARHTPKSILLVEDSEDDYEATKHAFKKADFHTPMHWCKSGQEALAFLNQRNESKHENPSLILLDLNMPGLDGRKILKIIKEDSALKQIPVIILTTSNAESDVTACYQMGANTYVQKPVNFDGLIEAVKTIKAYWCEIALLPKNH